MLIVNKESFDFRSLRERIDNDDDSGNILPQDKFEEEYDPTEYVGLDYQQMRKKLLKKDGPDYKELKKKVLKDSQREKEEK